MKRLAAAAVAAVLFSGCAPMQPGMRTPAGLPQEVVDSEYDPVVTVKGAQTTIGYFYGSPEMSWRLMSTFDKKTKTEAHGVVFVNRYERRGWRFWNAATNSDAERLDVHVIDRSVGYCSQYRGCSHTEQIIAFVSPEQLKKASESGISIRLSSRAGDAMPIEYSAGEIQYQLHSLAEATAKYR